MGGAKKRSIAQAEKQQQLQTSKQQNAPAKTGKTASKAETSVKTAGLSLTEITDKDLSELAKIKALTPYAVATKYNLKLSAAKEVLETLEKKKLVQNVTSGGGLKIYRFVGNP